MSYSSKPAQKCSPESVLHLPECRWDSLQINPVVALRLNRSYDDSASHPRCLLNQSALWKCLIIWYLWQAEIWTKLNFNLDWWICHHRSFKPEPAGLLGCVLMRREAAECFSTSWRQAWIIISAYETETEAAVVECDTRPQELSRRAEGKFARHLNTDGDICIPENWNAVDCVG